MSHELFREGGPYRVRKTGHDSYEMSISIPPGPDGMLARECPRQDCSPAYFRVRPGTGITDSQIQAFCPYCRHSAKPSEFFTKAQVEYAKDTVSDEVTGAVEGMIRDALDLGPSGRKKIDGGLFSMEISFNPDRRTPPSRPIEEELRRDLTCPGCGLEHAVFGLATWCPDCGADLFLEHVRKEFEVVGKILAAIPDRRTALGARVAARDAENALEDTVSIFETVLKIMTSRHLLAKGQSHQEAVQIFYKTVRNTYQNVGSASQTFKELLGAELFQGFDDAERQELDSVFAMRHPIAHNLGIVDRRYLDRVRSGELEGREISANPGRIERTMKLAQRVLEQAYARVFAPAATPGS